VGRLLDVRSFVPKGWVKPGEADLLGAEVTWT
jgi:hypothetical protein